MSKNCLKTLKSFEEFRKRISGAIKIFEKLMKLRLTPVLVLIFNFRTFLRFENVYEWIIDADWRKPVIWIKSKEFVRRRMVETHFTFVFAVCIDEYYLLGDSFGQNFS